MCEPNEILIEDSCEFQPNSEEVRLKDFIILEIRTQIIQIQLVKIKLQPI